MISEIFGSDAIATGQASVGSTGTLICAARARRRRITVVNHGAKDVFLGAASTVATTSGAMLQGTTGNQIPLETAAAVYGVVGTGSQDVSYIEEY